MRVITAIEEYVPQENDISCFLAGGITNCVDWQKEVLKWLGEYENTDNLVIFNPRRENFPIDDPNASEEQINWEYRMLVQCDIFSIFFCGSESVQPICFFELGRYLSVKDNCIVNVDEEFSRKTDVIIQTNLIKNSQTNNIDLYTTGNPKEHARYIYESYEKLLSKK